MDRIAGSRSPQSDVDDGNDVQMIACEDCGRLVPEGNMIMHRAHGCGAQKLPAARQGAADDDEDDDDDDFMDVDEDDFATDRASASSSSSSSLGQAISNLPSRRSSRSNADTVDRSTEVDRDSTSGDRQRSRTRATSNVIDLAADSPDGKPRARSTTNSNPGNRGVLQVGDIVSLLQDDADDDGAADNDNATESASSDQWACPRCTLLNQNSRVLCEACFYDRRDGSADNDDGVRAADPTRRERLIGGDDFVFDWDSQRAGSAGLGVEDDSSSPSSYMSRGALLGGLFGGTLSYMRGRPISEGALEGAVGGAIGGSVLNEIMQPQQSPGDQQQREQRRRQQRQTRRNGDQAEAAGLSVDQSRSSAARGLPSYPSSTIVLDDDSDEDNSSPGQGRRRRQRQQPRSSVRVVRRQGPGGMTTIITSSGGGRGRSHGPDPLLAYMMQSMMSPGGFPILRATGDASSDGMTYEQLLQTFGDGTENMGADQGMIQSLPSATVKDPNQLPEDRRQCSICLEDFAEGDERKTLPCLHGFHSECVDKWLRTNGACPICKHRLGP